VSRKNEYRKPEKGMKTEYAEEIKMLKKEYSYQDISKITNTNKKIP